MATRTAIALMTRANLITNCVSRNVHMKTYALVSSKHVFAAAASMQSSQQQHYGQRRYATEKPQADVDPQMDASEAAKKLTLEVETLTKEVKELKEKNDEIMDKYKRALADSENLRVRLTKQIADAKLFGIQTFAKDLLEVADILGQATHSVPKDQLNQNPHLKNLYEGLIMTEASLLQAFKRHGLEPVNPFHEKFDPNMHEALFQKSDDTVEPNTIVEVTKLGYKLHERCIRPALVGVSKSS